ncbi:MAG: YkgJ family cysteine cluster protein [Syntrophobacteraceae bacterium]
MDPRLREKGLRLQELYREFEEAVRPQTSGAVCRAGCADCCTNVGAIDATTLEGWTIQNHLQSLPAPVQKEYAKKLKNNRKDKSTSKFARCAFLLQDGTCGIYSVRPFSCRRLYSVAVCGETGPTVHRGVWEIARRTAAAIQALDDTGYSGHISYILALLKDSKFRNIYLDGGFDPGAIQAYAREHSISINRFLAPRS